MSLKDDKNDGHDPHRILPDFLICRAMPSGISDLAFCLVKKPESCKYAEMLHGVTYCFHPDRAEIIAGTKRA